MGIEINFDGLVGPSHHYGGYAYGNTASMAHKLQVANPKKAALEGLNKMKLLADLGIPQAVLPPRMRPAFAILRKLGFSGSETQIAEKALRDAPALFYQLSTSSAMWAANSATISPSTDTSDGKLHITIANLQSQFHRSIEAEETYRLFSLIFPDDTFFTIHPPLPKGGNFNDEGAANHTRFCQSYGQKGVHLFVYARSAFEFFAHTFPFRQAKEASETVARQHGLNPNTTFFLRQNPSVIEEGVFHNDVIATANKTLFIYHEKAFVDPLPVIEKIRSQLPLQIICVTEDMLSVKEAVRTYLFNSQLLTLPDGSDLLLAPQECASLNLSWLPCKTRFVDLQQSMHNGGGPACLRIRCVVNEQQKKAIHPGFFLTNDLYQQLSGWVERYYRDRFNLKDFADPLFLREAQEALEQLSQILGLDSFYSF